MAFMKHKIALVSALGLACVTSQVMAGVDLQLDYEATGYFADGYNSDQRINNSVSIEAEYFSSWDDDAMSISFVPFYRHDEVDNNRSHGGVRELIWNMVSDEYELKIGIGKVFWGVTESAHLVDIINQTDSVESLDGEQKLGQPMVQLLLEREWGSLDVFLLPYHRERTFAGADARLSAGVDYADAIYESSDEEKNIDVAVRYNHYWEDFEYAASFFHGTSREASLGVDAIQGKIIPYYALISQLGIEFQYLNEGWAWKFEGIYRDGMLKNSLNFFGQNTALINSGSLAIAPSENYFATASGFEYTQVGIFESRVDLGWVVEHLYDSRQEKASLTAFEHDLLLATRWAANNSADSTLLAGVLYDYEYQGYSLSFEGTTRLFDGLSLSAEARVFAPNKDNRQYSAIKDEDFIKLTFSYYL